MYRVVATVAHVTAPVLQADVKQRTAVFQFLWCLLRPRFKGRRLQDYRVLVISGVRAREALDLVASGLGHFPVQVCFLRVWASLACIGISSMSMAGIQHKRAILQQRSSSLIARPKPFCFFTCLQMEGQMRACSW